MTAIYPDITADVERAPRTSGIHVQNLTVRFGGLVAVDGVTLHAPEGQITGLIGPNGAGKTTIFNACTGLVRPATGGVTIRGTDAGSLPPQARARLGLGRTFQRMELFDSLPVWDNVAMGCEGVMAGNKPWRHIVSTRSAAKQVAEATSNALALCGIEDLSHSRPADLSTGQRRLVELARVAAGDFQILLLDEPSSGLDNTESKRFGSILTSLVEQRGVGILLVEHDVALVMSVCDHVYVLDFGKLIFQGGTDDVADSPEVRAAYLGTSAEAEAVGLG